MANIEVVPGSIRISSIDEWTRHDDIAMYYINCHSKYPEILMGENQLTLYRGERTLNTAETDQPTIIKFLDFEVGEDDGWLMSVDGGRYSVYVTFVKVTADDHKLIWSADT